MLCLFIIYVNLTNLFIKLIKYQDVHLFLTEGVGVFHFLANLNWTGSQT